MASVEDVLDKVQSLGYGSDTEGPQIKMINGVHKRLLNARRWTFTLSNTNLATTVGDTNVTWSTQANSQRIDAVRAQRGSEFYLLEPMDLPELRDLIHTNQATGAPKYWANQAGQILLWPVPDAVYTIAVAAVENPNELTAKADEVQVPDSHVDILSYGVIMDLTFRERDWDGHNFARQMYAELYTEMLGQFGMKQRGKSSHVESSGSWEQYDIESGWLVYGP
jgi:hypothetical protein